MPTTLTIAVLATLALYCGAALAAPPSSAATQPLSGPFRWVASPPLVAPADRPDNPCISIKDPTVVRFNGKWHLFCTIRGTKRTHAIEYLSFEDWKDADAAPRHILSCWDGYFCAPQVFYFTPHKKWYLIYQASDPARTKDDQYGPSFSTSDNLADPDSWTKPARLVEPKPANIKGWLDFWVICDDRHAYLFFTSLDGRMWRMRTALADFPKGWGPAEVALQADIFEASHTYKIRGQEKYLTLIEAQGGGGRYYKAYLADALDGKWTPLADQFDHPFAGPKNVHFSGEKWSDSISHGELLRAGHDEKLEIDPDHLQFLFQGVPQSGYAGNPYGKIPWRLGLLTRE